MPKQKSKKAVLAQNKRHGQRIRARREQLGLDVSELAALLGVSQPAVSQWELGTTQPRRDKLVSLAEILHVPVTWILSEDEPLAQNVKKQERTMRVGSLPIDVPVYGVAVGGSEGDFRFNGQVVDYVRRPPGIANLRNVYALWILGDSMSPWNKDGDLIYVSPAKPPTAGEYVVVQMQDNNDGDPGPAMVKLLVGRTPTLIKLAQHNPQREFSLPLAKVKSIHKVLSLRDLLGT